MTRSDFSPAAELHQLAVAVSEKHAADITVDERVWALEMHSEVLSNFRRRAEAGNTYGDVDIPESDVRPGPFLRGGGAALRTILEKDGFTVALFPHYAGRSAGEYVLRVSW